MGMWFFIEFIKLKPIVIFDSWIARFLSVFSAHSTKAVMLFPFILVSEPDLSDWLQTPENNSIIDQNLKEDAILQKKEIFHEEVHFRQACSGLVIFFYLENLIYKLFLDYEENPFEVEAHKNSDRYERNFREKLLRNNN